MESCSQNDSDLQYSSISPRAPSSSQTLDLGFSPLLSAGLLATAICQDSIFKSDLANHGWSLVCTPVLTGAEISHGIVDGWLDIGTVYEQTIPDLCNSGQAKILSIADQSYRSLISSSPLLTSEIIYKKIGYPQSPISKASFVAQMHKWNILIDSTQLIPIPIDELFVQLQNGKIDLIISWEPLSSLILESHPEWQSIFRSVGTSYWVAHPLLLQDTLVSEAFLRSQIRQLYQLTNPGYRESMEIQRWEYATILGFPVPSPKALHKLATNPSALFFFPGSFVVNKLSNLPEDCIDSTSYRRALNHFRKDMSP